MIWNDSEGEALFVGTVDELAAAYESRCKSEEQHLDEIERLRISVKECETGLNCLRGLQKAGNDMCDDLRREWKKAEDEVKRLQALIKHTQAMHEILKRAEPVFFRLVADDLYKGPLGDTLRLLEQTTMAVLARIEEDGNETSP